MREIRDRSCTPLTAYGPLELPFQDISIQRGESGLHFCTCCVPFAEYFVSPSPSFFAISGSSHDSISMYEQRRIVKWDRSSAALRNYGGSDGSGKGGRQAGARVGMTGVEHMRI